jgi:Carboxypeptidase regulatory-like domain
MRIFTFFIAAFVAVSTCFAQDGSSGVIRGVVLDPVNRRVPGATIALVNNGTGFRYQQMSDIEGRFAFQLLPPGEYSARVTSDGMSPQLNDHVEVNLGGATEIEFRLTVAGTRESVTVSAEAKVVETEPRGTSAVIDERAIANLPLNGRRFTDLSLLASQATQDPRGQNSTSNGDLSFGGIRGFQTSYLVDGGDNNNAFFAQARGRYRAPYQFSNELCRNSASRPIPFRRIRDAPGAEW